MLAIALELQTTARLATLEFRSDVCLHITLVYRALSDNATHPSFCLSVTALGTQLPRL